MNLHSHLAIARETRDETSFELHCFPYQNTANTANTAVRGAEHTAVHSQVRIVSRFSQLFLAAPREHSTSRRGRRSGQVGRHGKCERPVDQGRDATIIHPFRTLVPSCVGGRATRAKERSNSARLNLGTGTRRIVGRRECGQA